MSSITPPKPETTRAYLISAGYKKPTATVHHYFETRVATIKGIGQVWEYIFKCFRTGAERRWGIGRGLDEDADALPPTDLN